MLGSVAGRAALFKEDGLYALGVVLSSTGEKMGLSALTGWWLTKVVAAQKPFLPPMLQCPGVAAPNLFGTRGPVSWKTIFAWGGVHCAEGCDAVDKGGWGGVRVGWGRLRGWFQDASSALHCYFISVVIVTHRPAQIIRH